MVSMAHCGTSAESQGASPMNFLDWLTGTKRPAAGVPAKTPAEVRADLLAVNRPTAPFIVRDGAPENVDLVAEWRIVDATWYETFAKARLKKVFKVLIKLDEHASEVRAVDHEWSVEWPLQLVCRAWKTPPLFSPFPLMHRGERKT